MTAISWFVVFALIISALFGSVRELTSTHTHTRTHIYIHTYTHAHTRTYTDSIEYNKKNRVQVFSRALVFRAHLFTRVRNLTFAHTQLSTFNRKHMPMYDIKTIE